MIQRAIVTYTLDNVASTWSYTNYLDTSVVASVSTVVITLTVVTVTTARRDSIAVVINQLIIARLADVSII